MSIPKKATYKSAYDELGNVRLQQDITENLPQETRRRKKTDKDRGFEKSEFEKFWGLRRDIGWAELPGRMPQQALQEALKMQVTRRASDRQSN